jgi:hypothetical protein
LPGKLRRAGENNVVLERTRDTSAARGARTADVLRRPAILIASGAVAVVIALLSTLYSAWPGSAAGLPRSVLVALGIEALGLLALGVALARIYPDMTPRERNAIWLALPCLVGFVITILSAYPGHSNFDEVYSLSEYWSGVASDLHPPLQAVVWAGLMNAGLAFGLSATAQASLILFAQAALFWLAAGLLAALIQTKWLARAFLLVLALSPSSLAFVGFTSKDGQFAVAMLLAVALLAFAVRRRSHLLLALTVVPLFYGFAVRSNGPTAVLPLCFFWAVAAYDLLRVDRVALRKALAVMAISVALFAGLFGATRGLSRLVTQVNCCLGEQAFMPLVYDLMGVSVRLNENIVPPIFYLDPNYDLDIIKKRFDPFSLNFDGLKRVTPDLYGQAVRAWLQTLRDHPRELILHRLELIANCLGLHRGPTEATLFLRFFDRMTAIPMPERVNDVVQTYLRIDRPFLQIRTSFERYFRESLNWPLYRPWVYIAALTVAFAIPGGRVAHPAATWLTASVVCYLLPYVLLANSPHFRYFWWAALAMFVAFILRVDAIIQRWRPAREAVA